MKTYSSKWWELDIPDNWKPTSTRDDVQFLMENGDEIKIVSLLKQHGDASMDDLNRYAKSTLDKGEGKAFKVGTCEGLSISNPKTERLEFIFLRHRALILIISLIYNSDVFYQEREVANWLSSLRIIF